MWITNLKVKNSCCYAFFFLLFRERERGREREREVRWYLRSTRVKEIGSNRWATRSCREELLKRIRKEKKRKRLKFWLGSRCGEQKGITRNLGPSPFIALNVIPSTSARTVYFCAISQSHSLLCQKNCTHYYWSSTNLLHF